MHRCAVSLLLAVAACSRGDEGGRALLQRRELVVGGNDASSMPAIAIVLGFFLDLLGKLLWLLWMIVYIIFQRRIIQGVTMTGMGGR